MSEIRVLTMLELKSFYGINRFLHSRDKKERKRMTLLGVVWMMLIFMIMGYVGAYSYGLSVLGLRQIIPAYLTMLSGLLIIAFGFLKAGNMIFRVKGYDILAAMPVKPFSIVVSRFLAMYAEDLILTLVIVIPGMAVYGVMHQPSMGAYAITILGTLLIPAIPLVIATIAGTVIIAISSRMKRKSMVQTLLMLAVVFGVSALSFGMENMPEEIDINQIMAMMSGIGVLIGQIYAPAMWLNRAITEMDMLQFLLFAGVSIAAVVVAVYVVAVYYERIIRRFLTFSAKHNYQLGELEHRGLMKTLYIREAKQYFSSGIYVTNTIIGPILGCVMAVGLSVVGPDAVLGMIPLPMDITGLVPLVLSLIFCMMTTSSCSISMEGKYVWIAQTLPVSMKAILDSKIVFNLSLIAPFLLISEVALCIGLKPDFMELVWLVCIPTVVILFSVVIGITINLCFRNYGWEKEEEVVKQGISAMLGGFAGPLLSMVWMGVVIAVPNPFADMAKGILCVLLLIITSWLYQKNNKTRSL